MLRVKSLFHPLLPQKFEVKSGDEKLIFALCGKCASDQNFTLNCAHFDEEIPQPGGERNLNTIQLHLNFNGENVNFRTHWPYHNERFDIDGVAYSFVLDPNFSSEDIFEGFHRIVEEIIL